MKEYERRIQEHQKRLPHLRERVAATAVLFVVGILMLSTVTFSWLTLSVAPEASNISMSISTNGSLEIALAHEILRDESGNPILDENGNVIPLAPGASSVGDSLKDIVQRNTTWGNLINLSDASYALEKIVLRPATLNRNSLLSQPLYAATYDKDGRISSLDYDFAYTQWNSTLNSFVKSDYKGVKAISSVEFDESIFIENPLLGKYKTMLDNVNTKIDTAAGNFKGDGDKTGVVDADMVRAINGLMSTYMNGTLRRNVNGEICSADDIKTFYNIMVNVQNTVMLELGDAYMELIEVYQIDTYGENTSTTTNYTPCKDIENFWTSDINAFLNEMNNARTAKGKAKISLPNVVQYAKDRKELQSKIEELAQYVNTSTTTWGEIAHIVNFVVDINTCTVNGDTIYDLLSSLSSNISKLNSMLNNNETKNNAIVHNGLLQRLDLLFYNENGIFYIDEATITIQRSAFEKRLEGSSYQSLAMGKVFPNKDVTTRDVYANIRTSVSDPKLVNPEGKTAYDDTKNAEQTIDAKVAVQDFVAQDTYGLSIDFWVKTNSSASFLLLEGEVQYIYEDVYINVLVNAGEENETTQSVQVFLADVSTTTTETGKDPETITINSQEVYSLDGIWYYASNNQKVEGSETITDDSGNEIAKNEVKIDGTPTAKQNKIVSGYSGANRVWTEEELKDMSNMEYRTTQGTGSCYTFHADPAEAQQILKILEALTVAFVDAEGRLVGSARLATELCYSEYGKHTVPMVLNEKCMGTGTYDDDGNEIRAITELEKNQATLITAIIYLDGAIVSNETVLASSNIEGRFNIQFGSTEVLEPIDNEELMGSELVVSGVVADTNGQQNPVTDYYLGMEESGYKTTVTLTFTGEAPSAVHAYFLRKISETHGTRQEKITFTQSAISPNQWTAEMKFYAPGTYILRSVIADGIERDLQNGEISTPPTVVINGFSCTNFRGTNPQKYLYRTADSFVNEKFYVSVSAKDEELVPKSVEGIFLGDNGKSVSITFSDTDRDTVYEGLATFQASGTYTCKYLIIDGEYYELPVEYVREVYTGLEVAVWISQASGDEPFQEEEQLVFTEQGYQYVFRGATHEFKVQMRIYDSEGNTIEGLNNVNLFYSQDMDATLSWDPSTHYYIGHLHISEPGEASFVEATVNGERIKRARSAMSITAIPSESVEYKEISGDIPDRVIRLDDADDLATVSVKFVHAESATVYGKFKRTFPGKPDEHYIIKARRNTTDKNIYTFTIPDLDGFWNLEEIKMSKVFDGENEVFCNGAALDDLGLKEPAPEQPIKEEEYCLAIDPNDSTKTDRFDAAQNYYSVDPDDAWSDSTTKVIKNIYVSDDITYTAEYKDNNFLVAYNIAEDSSKVTLTDFNGDAVDDVIKNVLMEFTYQTGTAEKYGGYTWNETNVVPIQVNLDRSSDGKTFSNSNSGNEIPGITYAGKYSVALTYTTTFGKSVTTEYDITKKMVEVYSKKPTVTISAISPTGTFDADKNGKGSGHASGNTPTFSDTSATVYFKCEQSGWIIIRHNYTRPSVTITLSGLGTAKSAELSFVAEDGNTARVYNDNTQTGTYIWTADNTAISRNIGYYQSKKAQTDNKTPAGTITATQLTFVGSDNVAYTFTVPTITINNPY